MKNPSTAQMDRLDTIAGEIEGLTGVSPAKFLASALGTGYGGDQRPGKRARSNSAGKFTALADAEMGGPATKRKTQPVTPEGRGKFLALGNRHL